MSDRQENNEDENEEDIDDNMDGRDNSGNLDTLITRENVPELNENSFLLQVKGDI